VFDSRVEYSGTFDRMERLLTNRIGPNPRWRPTTILGISSDDISGTGRPINFTFDSMCLLSAASEPHRLPACACYLWRN